MNKAIEYLINSRTLTTFKPLETELNLDKDKNYLFDLSYLGVLNISGDKALEFLQGQLTCDVHAITDNTMIQGAQCNLKGRILALLDIVNWSGLKLVLPLDLINATEESLKKTALLSRVSIKQDDTLKVFGFYRQNVKDSISINVNIPEDVYGVTFTEKYCCYHLGHGFYVVLVLNDFVDECCQAFIKENQMLGSLTWHSLRLQNRFVDIYPESRGLFLPHRLGLHKTDFISFNKGCYKGQEIIARTHYKATIKHELKTDIIETSTPIFSGQKLFNKASGAEIGELIDYSILGNQRYLIAVTLLKDHSGPVVFERLPEP